VSAVHLHASHRVSGTEPDVTQTRARPLGAELALLLRDPSQIARRSRDEDNLQSLAMASMTGTVAGSAVFGGVLGAFRGGWQIAIGAGKVPLALLATLAITVPAFYALAAAFGRAWTMRTAVAVTLAAAARASLVLLAAAPVLWLGISWGLSYHASTVAAAIAYGLAGLAALGVLLRSLADRFRGLVAAAVFITVFVAVGGQTAWILRPYLGRPSHAAIPLLRASEGSFADAVSRSLRSAVGIYDAVAAESDSALVRGRRGTRAVDPYRHTEDWR
jgi:hypothetical protein